MLIEATRRQELIEPWRHVDHKIEEVRVDDLATDSHGIDRGYYEGFSIFSATQIS